MTIAAYVTWRMPSGGEAETALCVDIKERLLKRMLGLVKINTVEWCQGFLK
jgi:hypothetical protein